MTSIVKSALKSDATKARRYSAEEWEAQKSNVERLYLTDDKPLKEVIHVLKQEHNFACSEKQIKSRLTKWGFDIKNLRGETMMDLARTNAKRKLENKKSSFRVNKKPVDDRKIERFLERKDISEEQLLSMASPVNVLSPTFSVFTPESIHSPLTGDSSTHSLRSISSSLNFQALSIVGLEFAESDPLPTSADKMVVHGHLGKASPSTSSQAGAGNIPQIVGDTFRRELPSPGPSILQVHSNTMDETQSASAAMLLQVGAPALIFKPHRSRTSSPAGWSTAAESATSPREEPCHPSVWPATALTVEEATMVFNDRFNYTYRASPSITWPAEEGGSSSGTISYQTTRPSTTHTMEPNAHRSSNTRHRDHLHTLIWYCGSCGIEGGMTIAIQHCPGCNHLRCEMCPLENVKVFSHH